MCLFYTEEELYVLESPEIVTVVLCIMHSYTNALKSKGKMKLECSEKTCQNLENSFSFIEYIKYHVFNS